MSYISIRLDPGLDVEETATYGAAGFNEMDYGRFRNGLFEKLGGWTKYYPLSVSGTGKALWAWQDLDATQHLAAATTTEVDVITDDMLQVITPQELLTNPAPDFTVAMGDATVEIVDAGITNVTDADSVEFLTPVSVGEIILSGTYRITSRTGAHSYTIEARAPAIAAETNGGAVPEFTTTLNSSIVSVELEAHNQAVGNQVVFPLPTTVGGIVVQGLYSVLSITSVDVFTIAVSTAATSGATVQMNGGDVGFRYSISATPAGGGLGYGLGDYGEGAYGLGGGAGSDQVGDPLVATDYTLDNWGELLLLNPEGRGIYYWGAKSGFLNAALITEGPQYNNGMFVSMGQQQIIAYGSSIKAYETGGIGEYQDPLWYQWCDLSNFFDWTPRATNQAGGLRLPSGSKIVGGGNTKNRNLLWSDLELWSLTYVNQPLIYVPNKVGDKCGLVGKHAWAAYGDAVYWMSNNNFFVYSGAGVQPIPCTVWDDVFQDLDRANIHKVVCGSNSDFTEIWWFFPSRSIGSGAPDKAVKYNIIEGTWDTMPFGRFAWIDRSILGNPIAISSTGILYSHEDGYNADDAPLTPRMLTGNFALNENQDFVHVDEFVPDFKWGLEDGSQSAQISITLWTRETPGEDPIANGPYLVTQDTTYVTMDPPLRAKLIQVEASSADTDSFWRMGLLRFRQAPAGRQGFGV
jgi:hypothetical protein